MQERILILTVSHGASHERVARALRSALVDTEPGLTVRIIDVLEHSPPWFRFYYDSYRIPLKLWPGLWRRIERAQHYRESSGPLWLYRRAAKSLHRFIAGFDPAVVVATEVGTCELAVLMKREMGAQFELVGAPTGLDADRAWAQPDVRFYIVATEETARDLIVAGVDRRRIRTTGQPVDPAFSAVGQRTEIRGRLGVPREAPLLLVLFGGMGSGRPDAIVENLRRVKEPLEIVFIAGRNRAMENRIRQLIEGRPRWQVFGWVDNMHEWMAAADLALSKPGASTVIEALASGLPLLAIDPLPGNERRACDWIESKGVGLWIRDASQIAPSVARLLSNPSELEALRDNAMSHARPRAAYDAALAILELLRNCVV